MITLRRLRSRVRQLLPAVDPRSYWERRHRRFQGGVVGVGHRRLTEAQNRHGYGVKAAALREVLGPAPGTGRRTLLDAGCGVGAFFPLYAELGFDISGIDFSETAVKQASTFPGAKVTHGDIATLAGGPFDVVISVDVLFHVLLNDAWRGFLAAARDLLAPRGRLVIQEHLVEAGEYRGVRRHCHFRRASDYDDASRALGLRQVSRVRYALPEERTHKDLLVFCRLDH